MAKPIKTNVLRHLDAAKIPYETREYDVSDENYDGTLVAAKVNLPAEMIYKTLVLTGDKTKYLVCVIPVEKELDLKAVARATGNKSVAMLPQKELLPLTSYLRGGCSPIGMKKAFPTFLQEDAQNLERISVSAGVRGCQVILSVDALVTCTKAVFAALCRP
jgi:Cys-tRNA(Pro)/Cys-tRNA(Cys) deacylase